MYYAATVHFGPGYYPSRSCYCLPWAASVRRIRPLHWPVAQELGGPSSCANHKYQPRTSGGFILYDFRPLLLFRSFTPPPAVPFALTLLLSRTTMASSDSSAQPAHEQISEALEVEQLDVSLFRSKTLHLPPNGRGVFGGQVISQALVSATRCVDPAYSLHVRHIRIFRVVLQSTDPRTHRPLSLSM